MENGELFVKKYEARTVLEKFSIDNSFSEGRIVVNLVDRKQPIIILLGGSI